LSIAEAYALALAHIGPASNRMWCISGNCQTAYGPTTFTHWEFGFSDTNGALTKVEVFFDKTVCHMEGAACLGGRLTK